MLSRGRTRVKANRWAPAPRWLRWLAALAWAAGIFYLSHQSAPLGQTAGAPQSNLAHLAIYAVLAVLLFWALSYPNGRSSSPLWARASVAFALTVLYGVSDELHQAFVPGRSATEADIVVDAAGAALGLTAALTVALLSRPSHPPVTASGDDS
jgi:VanZ family protein